MDGSDEYTDANSDAESTDSSDKFHDVGNGDPVVQGQAAVASASIPVDGGHTDESTTDNTIDDSELFGSGKSVDPEGSPVRRQGQQEEGIAETENTEGSPDRRPSPQAVGFAETDMSTGQQFSTESSFEILSHSSTSESMSVTSATEQGHVDSSEDGGNGNDKERSDTNSLKHKGPPIPPKPWNTSRKDRSFQGSRMSDEQQSIQIGDEPGETSDELKNTGDDKESNMMQGDESGKDVQKEAEVEMETLPVTSDTGDIDSEVQPSQNILDAHTDQYFPDREDEVEIEDRGAKEPENKEGDSELESDVNQSQDESTARDSESLIGKVNNEGIYCTETSPGVENRTESDQLLQSGQPGNRELSDSQFIPADEETTSPNNVVPSAGKDNTESNAETPEEDTLSGSTDKSETTSEQRPFQPPSTDAYDPPQHMHQTSEFGQHQEEPRNAGHTFVDKTVFEDPHHHVNVQEKVETGEQFQGISFTSNEGGNLQHDIGPVISGQGVEPSVQHPSNVQHIPESESAPKETGEITHEDPKQQPEYEHTSNIFTHTQPGQPSPSQQSTVMSRDQDISQEEARQSSLMQDHQHGHNIHQHESHQQPSGPSLQQDSYSTQTHPDMHRQQYPSDAPGKPGGRQPYDQLRGHMPPSAYDPVTGQPIFPHNVSLDPTTGSPLYKGHIQRGQHVHPQQQQQQQQHQQQQWQQQQHQWQQQQYNYQQYYYQQQQYFSQRQQPQFHPQQQDQYSQQQYQQQQQQQRQQQQRGNQQQYKDPKEMQEQSMDESSAIKEKKKPMKTVRVEGEIKKKDSDMLQLYFESRKRSSGGETENITIDESKGTALITFVSEEVALRVTQQNQHIFSGKQLKVFLHDPSEDSVATKTIAVTGFPSSMTEDTLELYFENSRRSRGGTILETKIISKVAYIKFKEDGVAEKVVSQTEHKLSRVSLSVKLHQTPSHCPKTLAVSCYRSKLHNDTIHMYFESKKRSGGGEAEMREEKSILYFTFKSEEVVERVLKRCPHILEGDTLTVVRAGEETQEEDNLEEEKPMTTVEVRGYDTSASQDSIALYFENKRRSGGGPATVHRDDRKGVIYITFETEEVAERVASRPHKVSGKTLQVKLSQPQVMYKDKVLLTGVPEQTSMDNLEIYLEAKTGMEVADVLYGEETGEVLVSFSENIPDFNKLTETLTKKPLKKGNDSAILEASQVPETTCITVHDLPDAASEDLLTSYFENKKRSGGGEVEEVTVNHLEGFAVVKFKDTKVAEEVTKQSHKLCKSAVKVYLNFECLGEKGGSPEPPVCKLPDPETLYDIDGYKLKYLNKNQQALDHFKDSMANVSARLEMNVNSKSVTLSPTFTLGSKEAKKIIKTWCQNAKDKCRSLLEAIDVQMVPVNSEIWPDVDPVMNTFQGNEDTEVFTEEKDWMIVITGSKDRVSATKKLVQKEVGNLQAKYERKKSEQTETMKFNAAKLQLLLKHGILKKIQVNDLEVKVIERGMLSFTGQKADILEGKMKIFEEINNIQQQTVSKNFSLNQMELLKRPSVCQFLEKKLQDQSGPIAGCWEPGREGIIMYYTQDQDFEDLLGFLNTSLKETRQKLDKENLPLLSSTSFQEQMDKLIEDHSRRVIISHDVQKREVIITAVSNDAGPVETEVRKFIDENSIYTETYKCGKMKLKFLLLHCQNELRAIEKEMGKFCVEFICEKDHDSLLMKTTKPGLRDTKRMLHCIIQRVDVHKQHLNRPGIKSYLESGSVLKQVQQDARCVISLTENENLDDGDDDNGDYDDDVDDYDDDDATSHIPFVCHFDIKKQLHVVVGDLVSVVSDVDAVIVEATPNLGTDSKQAWDVIQKAGEKAVQEVRNFVRSGQSMEGEVFASSAGNLKCKMIVHAVGPCGSNNEREVIKTAVISSLEEALKKSMSSVALPAFNTTNVVSADAAVLAVVEGVHTFYAENLNCSVTDIYLCIEDWSRFQLLWDIAIDVFGEENVKSNNDEMNTTDSLHGGRRRGMGRRNDSLRFSSTRLSDLDEEQGAVGGFDVEEAPPPTAALKMPRPRILLVKADMGVEEADVIVNSSNKDLILNQGQVSKSLLKNAGQDIQLECNKKYPNGIKMGDIAVTKGGNMQCVQEIYHCTLPGWKDSTGKQTFTDNLRNLLVKTNEAKWETMAIPALGTGNLGYSRDLVAKLMYETVIKFGKDTPETTIKDVLFIVYPGDAKTIEAFEAEHKKYKEAAGFKVASSQKEIDEENQAELVDYRNKQGYAEKFGKAVSTVSQFAKSMFTKSKDPKPTREPPQPVRPPAPTPKRAISRLVSKPSQVPLWIYADDEACVGKAVNMIYDTWDDNAKTKEVTDDTVRSWTKTQVEDLITVENQYGVQIKVNKNIGCISIHGQVTNVSEAYGVVYQKIRDIEKETQEKEFAKEVQKLVQWFFVEVTEEGDDKMMAYEKEVNIKLERAYTKDKQAKFVFQNYVFDFEAWAEYPENDPTDRVQMIRRDKIAAAAFNQPDTWEHMPPDKDVQLKPVNNSSTEFASIQKKFTEALGNTVGQILRLDRIQSRTLYQQYQAKKQQLVRQNTGVDVEKCLWHGTQTSATMGISTYGFNRSYCASDKNALGEGAYFTADAGYAARDRYAPADAQGKRYMFMCKVLTGTYTKGQPNIRVPPPKDSNKPEVLYDCVVDDPANPQTFVIFNDSQAYPEYLISFQ